MLEARDRCVDGLGATVRRRDLAGSELTQRNGYWQRFVVVIVIGCD
jgi:hypothetical protein